MPVGAQGPPFELVELLELLELEEELLDELALLLDELALLDELELDVCAPEEDEDATLL